MYLFFNLVMLFFLSPEVDPSGETAVTRRIDEILRADIQAWCQKADVFYPPEETLLRVFKKERVCEIWVNGKQGLMVRVASIPVCAMDFEPGPKLVEGDGKTPEGFYRTEFHYWSQVYWMWISLQDGEIERQGVPGDGSCFKIFMDYPNILDRSQTRKAGFHSPGGAIFLHGNCVTAGCISFMNKDFLPVYAFSVHGKAGKHGFIHVFPFKFDQVGEQERQRLAEQATHSDRLGIENVLSFWRNLEEGYDLFNRTKNVPKVVLPKKMLFKLGDRSSTIEQIKSALKFKGKAGPEFSVELRDALIDFQRQSGLVTDGVAGSKTLEKLGLYPLKYDFLSHEGE